MIRFRLDDNNVPIVSEISEMQEGVYDGLYKSFYNSDPNYITYRMGKMIEEYTVKDHVIIREIHYSYSEIV